MARRARTSTAGAASKATPKPAPSPEPRRTVALRESYHTRARVIAAHLRIGVQDYLELLIHGDPRGSELHAPQVPPPKPIANTIEDPTAPASSPAA